MCLRFLMRCLLTIINLAFTLLGIALVVVGVLVKLKLGVYLEELKNSLLDGSSVAKDTIDTLPIDIGFIAYVIIAIGVVIFLIAFCGCCGSITESKCLLITYSIIMGLLTALKIAALILLLSNADYMKGEVESFLEETFKDPVQNVTFHIIEVYAECCGTYGPDSYDSYNMTYDGKDYVYPTCCGITTTNIEQMENATNATCLKEDAYPIGCVTYVGKIFKSVLMTTRNILIITIISESVLLICAVTIILTIKKR